MAAETCADVRMISVLLLLGSACGASAVFGAQPPTIKDAAMRNTSEKCLITDLLLPQLPAGRCSGDIRPYLAPTRGPRRCAPAPHPVIEAGPCRLRHRPPRRFGP